MEEDQTIGKLREKEISLDPISPQNITARNSQ